MRQSTTLFGLLGSLPIVGFLMLATGCSSSTERYLPAKGQVFVGGKPAAGAKVILVPRDESKDDGRNPSGKVGDDGFYQLNTYDPATRTVHDGARPGDYVVLVTWVPEPTERSLDSGSFGGDKLGSRYRDPKTTTLRAEVKEGVPELPTIKLAEADLKSRSK
jgi:hypothetical protein